MFKTSKRRHVPDGAIGAGTDGREALVSLGHFPDGLVQLLPVVVRPDSWHGAETRGGGGQAQPSEQAKEGGGN